MGLTAHPAYIARFAKNLATPGLRIPMTADGALFLKVADIGRRVVWLHSYGERMVDAKHGRPPGAPRLPAGRRPTMTGAIPNTQDGMPDAMEYDAKEQRLTIGTGWIDGIPTGGVELCGFRQANPAAMVQLSAEVSREADHGRQATSFTT